MAPPLAEAKDQVAETMLQLASWGLAGPEPAEGAELNESVGFALVKRQRDGRDGTGIGKLFAAAKGGKGALSLHELAVALSKVDVDSRGWSSQTALHVAAHADWADGIRVLLAHMADIEAADGRGMTPMLVAARHGCPAAIAALVDAGARTAAPPAQAGGGKRVAGAMQTALENVGQQPRCMDAAEVLAAKGVPVPRVLASTALLLAVQHTLPALRTAAAAATEWRGSLKHIVRALESHGSWDADELRHWLAQRAGHRPSAAGGAADELSALRAQVARECQQALQDVVGPDAPRALAPRREDPSKGFDASIYREEVELPPEEPEPDRPGPIGKDALDAMNEAAAIEEAEAKAAEAEAQKEQADVDEVGSTYAHPCLSLPREVTAACSLVMARS